MKASQDGQPTAWLAVGGILAFILGLVVLYPVYIFWLYFLARAKGQEERPALPPPERRFWLKKALPLALLTPLPLLGWVAIASLPICVYVHALRVGAHREGRGPSRQFLVGLGVGLGAPALALSAALLGFSIAVAVHQAGDGDSGGSRTASGGVGSDYPRVALSPLVLVAGAYARPYWQVVAYERLVLGPYEERDAFNSHERLPSSLNYSPCADISLGFSWDAIAVRGGAPARVEFLYYRQSSVMLVATGTRGQAQTAWCGGHTVRNPNPFTVEVTISYAPLIRQRYTPAIGSSGAPGEVRPAWHNHRYRAHVPMGQPCHQRVVSSARC